MCGCKNKVGMARKKKKNQGGILGNLNINMDALKRVGAVGVGAVAAKKVNAWVKPKVEAQFEDPRIAKGVLAGGKIVVGAVMMGQENQIVQDAGMGFGAIGAIELLDIVWPEGDLTSGLGYLDSAEYVGTTVEIDLDELAPHTARLNGTNQRLDDYQEVAGGDYLVEEMELAGVGAW